MVLQEVQVLAEVLVQVVVLEYLVHQEHQVLQVLVEAQEVQGHQEQVVVRVLVEVQVQVALQGHQEVVEHQVLVVVLEVVAQVEVRVVQV